MTVSATSNKVSYTANGSTTTFAYNFPIFTGEESTLNVYVDGTKKSLTTHYTVTNAGNSSGGNVVFTAGNTPANTAKVVIERILARTQLSDWNNYDKYQSETLENSVDRLTFIAQEIDEAVARSIRFATTVTDVGTVEVTGDAAARANKVFGFDNSGNLIATVEIGNFTGNWAASTAYVARDLIKDTSNNNIYICITSHTSSGAQPISSNTDAAKWSLLVDAASATTSQTAAATSASAAATSASSASTSASTATTQAGLATTAKTAAETAKAAAEAAQTASETAKTASETAKTASEAALDDFTDIFLGSKASDPTVDNDGDALTDAALYFNTTNNVLMVYDLGNTTWNRTTPTSTDQGHINTVSGIQANVTTVAGISSSVSAVAADSADIGVVAADGVDIGLVAGQISPTNNISSVAGAVTNIGLVGGSIANVNLVGGSISNVNTVGGSIADVNRYASEYTIATSAPGSPSSGDLWYDSSAANLLKYYNGTAWVGIAPGITSETDPNAAALALALG